MDFAFLDCLDFLISGRSAERLNLGRHDLTCEG